MSLFTWIGAAVGFNLAHFKFISFDFLTEHNYIRALLSQDAFRIPLNSFACTLSGALLGLLTHMTLDVSIPSLVVFLTLSIVTSKQCTKLFSSVCVAPSQKPVAPTQKPPITKEKEEEEKEEEEEKNKIQQQQKEGGEEGEEEKQKRKDQKLELLGEKDRVNFDTELKLSLEREIERERKEQEDREIERERKEREDRDREREDREREESEEFQDEIATNKGVICSQRKRRSNNN